MRQLYQRSRKDQDRQLKNYLSNIIKQKIKKYQNEQWHKKLENLKINDNSIWKVAKSFSKKLDNRIPTLHGANGMVYTDEEKADELAYNFERVHHLTENLGDDNLEREVNSIYNQLKNLKINTNSIELTTTREIKSAIKKTKPKKAPGPDQIQNTYLLKQ